jgi:hypothetical protein
LVEAMRTRMSFKLAIAADLSSGSNLFASPCAEVRAATTRGLSPVLN